jgi:hypothetical protein
LFHLHRAGYSCIFAVSMRVAVESWPSRKLLVCKHALWVGIVVDPKRGRHEFGTDRRLAWISTENAVAFTDFSG